jgi:hypothetical protein
MKTRIAVSLFAIAVASTAMAQDDVHRNVAERAASCWATPVSMRGIRFNVAFDITFTVDGHAEQVRIVDFVPENETTRALLVDFAESIKHCGPYTTQGQREMSLNVSWPM